MDGTNADRTASGLFLHLGPASGEIGHMFWLRTTVPDVPAASQHTLTPIGSPLGFLQATRGRGLEDHQMGRMERSHGPGKSFDKKNEGFRSSYTKRSNSPDRPVAVARPTPRSVRTACAACAGCLPSGTARHTSSRHSRCRGIAHSEWTKEGALIS